MDIYGETLEVDVPVDETLFQTLRQIILKVMGPESLEDVTEAEPEIKKGVPAFTAFFRNKKARDAWIQEGWNEEYCEDCITVFAEEDYIQLCFEEGSRKEAQLIESLLIGDQIHDHAKEI